MGHTPIQELSLKIQSELDNNIYEWDRYQHANMETAWRIANALAFSLNGRDIEFLAGAVHSQETGEIEIAAYTQQHLVYYRGTPDREGPSFRIIPRRDISELVVHSAPAVLTVPSRRIPTSYGAYEVTYGSSINFALPLTLRTMNAESLDAFFPSLWDDLLK